MKKKELREIVGQKHKKYNDLLWYARKHPEDINIPGVKQNMERIEQLYPEDIAALKGEDKFADDPERHADWAHGFNSGCAAAFFYVSTCLDTDIGLEMAEADFPMLDT